jgi:hypothetical protein
MQYIFKIIASVKEKKENDSVKIFILWCQTFENIINLKRNHSVILMIKSLHFVKQKNKFSIK